jgi:hypothetical protein
MTQSIDYWVAQTEAAKTEIAHQQFLRVDRQLQRAKREIRFEDIADKKQAIQIKKAETNLLSEAESLKAEQIGLKGAQNRTKYLSAKQGLENRIMATELLSIEVNLSTSEAKLADLRETAKILNRQLKTYIPRNLFGAATDGTAKVN